MMFFNRPTDPNHRIGARRPVIAGLLVVTALLPACGTAAGTSTVTPTTSETTSAYTTPSRTTTPPRTTTQRTTTTPQETTEQGEEVDALLGDISTAIQTTNTFWNAHWTEHFTGTYEAPMLVDAGYDFGLYDGMGDAPSCNGEVLETNNAYYCPAGDFMAFDLDLMLQGLEIGDAFVYLVVAHEWGHAIQARLDGVIVSQAGELQADCFAAAALYGAVADGLLMIEEGDIKEIAEGLTYVSDESPWGDAEDHGDPFDRLESFRIGRDGGVNACLPTS